LKRIKIFPEIFVKDPIKTCQIFGIHFISKMVRQKRPFRVRAVIVQRDTGEFVRYPCDAEGQAMGPFIRAARRDIRAELEAVRSRPPPPPPPVAVPSGVEVCSGAIGNRDATAGAPDIKDFDGWETFGLFDIDQNASGYGAIETEGLGETAESSDFIWFD
jgi:hypothetical protein